MRGPLPVVPPDPAAAHGPALSGQGCPRSRARAASRGGHGAPSDRAARRSRRGARDHRERGAGTPRRDVRRGGPALATGRLFWRGSLWIADAGNHRLRRADLETRELHTIGGPLRSPWDVAPYADDILVIAMAGTHQLWGYDPNYDRTGVVAGSGREGLVDGPAVQADLAQPSGLASLGRLLGFVDAESSSLRGCSRRARWCRGGDRRRQRALRVGGPRRLDRRGAAAAPDGSRGAATRVHRLGHVQPPPAQRAHGDRQRHDRRRQHPRLPRRHRCGGPLLRAGRRGSHRRRADRGGHRQPCAPPRRSGNRRGDEPAADGARAPCRAGRGGSRRRRSPSTRSSRCSSRSRRLRERISTRAAPHRCRCA